MERLQNVADAYKELEKRRKGRKKKGPQPGGNVSFDVTQNCQYAVFCIFCQT